MKFTILTIFPEMFAPLQESIIKRAQENQIIEVNLVNFRDFAESKHKNVDDVPYGGGDGMVLKPEPIFAAVKSLGQAHGKRKIILTSPQGRVFQHKIAQEYASLDELIFICGHYEGFDERIRTLVDEEISIGDYVLTGGELPAMVIIDAVSRLIPGVLGKEGSCIHDSHSNGLLEYPQYTRPPVYEGISVPEILLSGHHAMIEAWRRKESLRRTFLKRPDLITDISYEKGDYKLLEELAEEHPEIAVHRSNWSHLKPVRRKR